ncbi:PREDICTED: far upstream element-binding protein 2-like [Populus euphratica]|uniref:Far upstream element-binding protein 2-like n=1 Tax=Populus euphratica TaxID=75702 RepID=A0AAJ6UU99_POPEU|nr:PREDICTED: far upstream element-binding protein 2-like [Populus euphratica]XP_011036259.1 PREDICTED: far upstream element-binding protein 2-like [Populus euphratica]XP_011036260.1 PREDICTED: far upstream element-binding protein 2-like [Populus euphratica]
MAAEEVVAPAVIPVASDHKRKLGDLEPEVLEQAEPSPVDEQDPEVTEKADDVEDGGSPETKRLRIDEKTDGLASENGFKGDESGERAREETEEQSVENEQEKDGNVEPPSEEVLETTDKEETNAVIPETDNTDQPTVDGSKDEDAEKQSLEDAEKPSLEDAEEHLSEDQTTSRKMEVPNDKVGVLIGKGGDTIRYLQYNSGAKIQITRDSEANPQSTTRPVELIGTLSSIRNAEKLINAVIAEADAGGSPSLVAMGLASSAQTAGAGDQLEIPVPNEKVGLIIGRGGETIKGLQAKSGARIQLIPQHLPEGDGSKERTVRVTGDKRQVEMAREMIMDVMNQTVRPSNLSSSFNQQQSYRPRGPTGPAHWGPRGPHSNQKMPYDYQHRGPYPSQGSQYPPAYGDYPQHMAPRGNYSSGWEQRPANVQGPHTHTGGYDYYSQGGHVSDHPVSGPMPAPIPGPASRHSPAPVMGGPPSQVNYSYGQSHGPDYGHQAPYSQAAPSHQSYGHGYDEPKYPYGYGSSQPVYSQAGNQPGYGAQQQYGKQPSFGMPSQGPTPQSYGPPRPGQPGDMSYQGPMQSSQPYGSNAPPPLQQQYPYASSGPMQQPYPPYGSGSGSNGYNQAQTASGPGYPQQGGQPVPTSGQPGGQAAAGYAQGPAGGYGSYPSAQQGYSEQQAANNAGYGYQGSQDPAYGSAPAYGAPASQQGYAQPAPTQPSYDQSVPQSAGYGAAPATAPVGYGKTVSPQPGYPQYDSTQMYAAPR